MKRVELHLPAVWWIIVGIFAAYAVVCFCVITSTLSGVTTSRAATPGETATLCFFGILAGCVAAFFAISIARWRVVADEQGLRWRGPFGSWQNALWDEVTDFYMRSSSRNREKVIEFGQSKRLTVGGNATTLVEEQLAEMVVEYAIHAPFRSWGVKGTRQGESFRVKVAAWSVWWWGWGLVGFGLITLCLVKMSEPVASRNDWLWKIGPFALLLLPVGVLMAVAFIARFRERWESLEIDERGLKFAHARGEQFVGWGELRGIQRWRRRSLVRWEGGKLVMGGWLPLSIIANWGLVLAPEAVVGWDGASVSRSIAGDGARFSRPVDALALAVVFSTMGSVAIVGVGLLQLLPASFWYPQAQPQVSGALIPFLMVLVLAASFWATYLCSFVVVGPQGIEIGGIGRTRFLAWSEVEWRRYNKGTALWAKGQRVFLFNNTAQLPQALADEVGKYLTLREGRR